MARPALEVAFNSRRNRHCPKCQAAASRQWLTDREAELLPVPLCSVEIYALLSAKKLSYRLGYCVLQNIIVFERSMFFAIMCNWF